MLLRTSLFLFVLIETSLSERNFLIDMSHSITPTIPYFPSQTRFNFTRIFAQTINRSENSFFYSTNSFETSEHMGTHIDAPYHFNKKSWKLNEIPEKHLTSIYAVIVDVEEKCRTNPIYLITVDDFRQAEIVFPSFNDFRFVVLFHTGWSKFWPQQSKYAGADDQLQFPGLSESLARYLIETYREKLVGVGIDTLSTDFGPSKDFLVHQILSENNKFGLENVAKMDEVLSLVGKNFFILNIFPMKIENGTGAPCRLFAHVDGRDIARSESWFGLLVFLVLLILMAIIIKAIYDFNFNRNKKF